MRILLAAIFLAGAAAPAAAQTHARHTAAHDSAHAIMLDDAQHLALHQFLLGHWAGMAAHDSLRLSFENDSSHQQLMIRQHAGVAGFEIRGDTLRWRQDVRGSACIASTPVMALVHAAMTAPAADVARMTGQLTCGATQAPFTLTRQAPRR